MAARNYRKEYDDYHGKPEQIKRRAGRNKARAIMAKKQDVSGKDVDHKNHNTLDNRPSNLRVMSVSKNRSMNKKKKQ